MSEQIDPYYTWLGIPVHERPINHYRLLGISLFEDDADVIENAAEQRLAHVRTFQMGKHAAISQQILNEITAAKLCLLRSDEKAGYDAQLRQQIDASKQTSGITNRRLIVPIDSSGAHLERMRKGSEPPSLCVKSRRGSG